ncbi:MAG: alpha/beta hydrolase [Acidobacteriaceae bacterium]|jgi:pimeloyl-ACP methyl ester carboxylesterase
MPPAKPRIPTKTPAQLRETPRSPLEVVDPIWLVKALALSLIAAVICVYATLCLLVYQGEWQLVLHPVRAIDRTPASAGLDFEDVRFGAAETGQPRLTGWWIPAQTAPPPGAALSLQTIPKYADYTVLYLHDGSGSLSNTVPMIARLHQAGLNVFAIDYRGFGASDASMHPSDARMAEDAAAAFDYLTSTRHIRARNLIPYGSGLGAYPAVELAGAHPELPAVILDNPDPDPASTAAAWHPSHIIPVLLLFGKSFAIAGPLATLATPKLLIAGGPAAVSAARDINQLQAMFQQAASPRFAVTLPPADSENAYQAALSRFLDQYLSSR